MPYSERAQGRSLPWYFWVVVAVAILWNAFGTVLWAGTTFRPDVFLADLPAPHRDYVSSLPSWSTLTWGLGVLGGTVGSVLLLLRNRRAVSAFAVSLFGAIANTMIYVLHPAPEGFFNLPLTVFIIGFAAFLLWFALSLQRRGVI